MKKIILGTLLGVLLAGGSHANAQSLLERLASKKLNKKSSSSSSSKKSDLTILGKYHSLTIGGKQRGYQVMPIFEVELNDGSNTLSDGSANLMLTTEYTQNGRTGSGETFRKEINKDQLYFDDNGY